MGIAVGMATNMPPHNLGEVIETMLLMMERARNPIEITKTKTSTILNEAGEEEIIEEEITEKSGELSIDEIMNVIKGPDFPTGGIMFDSQNIKEIYRKKWI